MLLEEIGSGRGDCDWKRTIVRDRPPIPTAGGRRVSQAMSPEGRSDQAYPPFPNFLLLVHIVGGRLAL
jgi:hypothetical protein